MGNIKDGHQYHHLSAWDGYGERGDRIPPSHCSMKEHGEMEIFVLMTNFCIHVITEGKIGIKSSTPAPKHHWDLMFLS